MTYEKKTQILPIAEDQKQARKLCSGYGLGFLGLFALLLLLLSFRDYAPELKALVAAAYVLVALLTWLPMAMRCFAKLELAPEEVRIRLFGLVIRRQKADKIWFLTAMECSGKNRTAGRHQILLSAWSLEGLAKMGGWKKDESIKPKEELARLWLNRYAMAYYVRELNLTKNILWVDWSPQRLMLLRWMYPHAVWADMSHGQIYDRQLND